LLQKIYISKIAKLQNFEDNLQNNYKAFKNTQTLSHAALIHMFNNILADLQHDLSNTEETGKSRLNNPADEDKQKILEENIELIQEKIRSLTNLITTYHPPEPDLESSRSESINEILEDILKSYPCNKYEIVTDHHMRELISKCMLNPELMTKGKLKRPYEDMLTALSKQDKAAEIKALKDFTFAFLDEENKQSKEKKHYLMVKNHIQGNILINRFGLELILRNLFSNGLKYAKKGTRGGGRHMFLEIKYLSNGWLMFDYTEEDGKGFPTDHLVDPNKPESIKLRKEAAEVLELDPEKMKWFDKAKLMKNSAHKDSGEHSTLKGINEITEGIDKLDTEGIVRLFITPSREQTDDEQIRYNRYMIILPYGFRASEK